MIQKILSVRNNNLCYNDYAVTLSSRREVRRMNDPLIALAVAVVAGVAVHYICKWLDGQ